MKKLGQIIFIIVSFIGLMSLCGIVFRYFSIPWSAFSWWAGALCLAGWELMVEAVKETKDAGSSKGRTGGP